MNRAKSRCLSQRQSLPRSQWRAGLIATALVSGLAAQAADNTAGGGANRSGLTVEQVMALKTVTNPQLGDGFVAFNVVVPRPLSDGPGGAYLHLGVLTGDFGAGGAPVEPKWLFAGKGGVSGTATVPGRRAVSYLRTVNGRRRLFVHDIEADAAEIWGDLASISGYRWRPDGGAIAYTSLDEYSAMRAGARAAGIRPVVVDEDFRHLSLYVCEAGGNPRRLTEGVTIYDFAWSPDGKRLACAVAPRNLVDDSYMQKRLHVVDLATGKLEKLVDNPGKLGAFAWSPNGKRLAYISASDRNDPHAGMLYALDLASRKTEAWTYGLRGMIQDVKATRSGFLLTESIGVRTRLRHIDQKNKTEWTFEAKDERLALTGVSAVGGRFAFTASSPRHPPELFVAAGESTPANAIRLTNTNPVLDGATFANQRVVRFRARDRLPIEGLLMEPLGYVEGQRYPLVIVAHGGPESHHLDGWLTSYSSWGQMLAARGYFVWYPNYRASTGYGVQFCKADHGDPMGKEFLDHLDAIDHFVDQGLVDRGRVGIGGGSYGGYTAAWAATRHSEHFAAAVSFVPFVDIRTKWMTSDIPMEFYYVHYEERWPWQQPGLLADRSPLTWARDCRTPLLLAGGTSDTRVHPSQPFMLYRAVKFATETPTRYVQYPGEGHGNRSNVYRYDYALRALRWFDHYLGAGECRSKALPPRDLNYAGL
ncbi:MAG: alpha/beta fold hydrolase [bacterium]|nr:alpha/beta fold hydrolase [bacterium]